MFTDRYHVVILLLVQPIKIYLSVKSDLSCKVSKNYHVMDLARRKVLHVLWNNILSSFSRNQGK